MTFDEWFDKLGMPLAAGTGYNLKDVSRRAFEAGGDIEREACAKLAAAHFIYGHSVAGPHFAAALANKIRERSNA